MHTSTHTIMLIAIGAISFSASAGIVNVGGDTVIAEPPSSILHNQWESDTEIRAWLERETILTQDINLGHSQPGFVNDLSQLNGDTILSGTSVQSYMIRMDPVGQGPVVLSGFLVFDAEILGVYIGSQLITTDGILGRPGIVYNANPFRGMELDATNSEADSFEISQGRMRIDFVMQVGEWTDDIRVVTAVPAPGSIGVLGVGLAVASRRRRS